MKLKQEFVLRNIAGDYLLIPVVGIEDKFQGVITLNQTSAEIWKMLEEGKEKDEIVGALLEEYDVEKEHAEQNVSDFCKKLEALGIL